MAAAKPSSKNESNLTLPQYLEELQKGKKKALALVSTMTLFNNYILKVDTLLSWYGDVLTKVTKQIDEAIASSDAAVRFKVSQLACDTLAALHQKERELLQIESELISKEFEDK